VLLALSRHRARELGVAGLIVRWHRVRLPGHTIVLAAPTNPETKVITGHFGLGAAAKSVDRRAPLW
jgi:hypothetical protein